MRPPSFDEELSSDWGAWVLDYGLPDLPETVEVGWSVPVARWVGGGVGAVLRVQWHWSDDHSDDSLESDVAILTRSPAGWDGSGGSGGSGWFDPPLVRPQPSAGRHVFPMGMHGYESDPLKSSGKLWAAMYGVAAAPITSMSFLIDGVEVSISIESTLGAWVVGYVARPDFSDADVVIEAFDGSGHQIERLDLQQEKRRLDAILRGGPSTELVDLLLARLEVMTDLPVQIRDEARERATRMEPGAWMAWVKSALRAADQGSA